MKKLLIILLTVSLILTPLNAYAQTQTEALQSQTVEQIITQEPITVQDTSTVAPTGQLDAVYATKIGGWAWRSDIPNTPLNVHLYIRKTTETTSKIIGTLANGYRSDLANAGYGNGYHAFNYPMDWTTYTPGTYEVKAFAIGGNGINPQLSSSPKNFTVRAATGHVDVVRSDQIAGWAWKPDAPDVSIRAHIYIKRANGETASSYSIASGNYRSDLESLGYGNGNHGFVLPMDWSTLPEELLTVEVYAVDGSGHHPRIYLGYYNNKPAILLGATDENGRDRSGWMNYQIEQNLYNTGFSEVGIYTGFDNDAALDLISESSFFFIHTHSNKSSFQCSYDGEFSSVTANMIANDTTRNYSTTVCAILLGCEMGEGGAQNTNNLVNTLYNKGVSVVLGFEEETISFFNSTTKDCIDTKGTGLWAKTFISSIASGSTVQQAALAAEAAIYDYSYKNNIYATDEDGNIDSDNYEMYGLKDAYIAGNGNTVIKH